MSQENENLISVAIKIYKIPSEYVFASRINEKDEAVIVTNGGKKVIHKRGADPLFELSQIEITGQKPLEEMVWHEKLNQRISVNKLRDLLRLTNRGNNKV